MTKLSSINQALGYIYLTLLLSMPGLISASPDASEPMEETVVATKTVPGQRVFVARYDMPVVELFGKVGGLATRLASKQVRAGGEVDGPLHILVESDPENSGEEQEVWLAFPTKGNPRSSGRNRSIRTEPFRCVFLSYEGSAEGISSAMTELASAAEGAGYQLNGQARFVFACDGDCSKEHMMLELQLGIE